MRSSSSSSSNHLINGWSATRPLFAARLRRVD
jgi:hypothetical protein